MNANQYQTEAMRTKSPFDSLEAIAKNFPEIMHACFGAANETGEIFRNIKRASYGGKDLDLTNLDEEFGDLLWFVALYCDGRGTTISDLMDKNIAKLKVRFPDKFTVDKNENRDTEAEAAAMRHETFRPADGSNQFSVGGQVIGSHGSKGTVLACIHDEVNVKVSASPTCRYETLGWLDPGSIIRFIPDGLEYEVLSHLRATGETEVVSVPRIQGSASHRSKSRLRVIVVADNKPTADEPRTPEARKFAEDHLGEAPEPVATSPAYSWSGFAERLRKNASLALAGGTLRATLLRVAECAEGVAANGR